MYGEKVGIGKGRARWEEKKGGVPGLENNLDGQKIIKRMTKIKV